MTNVQQGRFAGKVALISGGGAGIGAAIANQLAGEGAAVALCGRRGFILDARVAALTTAGHHALAVVGDVGTDAAQIVETVVQHFGRLDVLVNNAGVSSGFAIDEMSFSEWRRVQSVNLDGTFEMTRHALPHLVTSRGCILHISSISAVAGELDDVAYAASKAAVEGFSRKLALELAPQGVRSNVIRPGLIKTEAFDAMPADFFDSQIRLIPLRQIGQPDDIARAAAFLCSADARFITGTVLTVDGGESAK